MSKKFVPDFKGVIFKYSTDTVVYLADWYRALDEKIYCDVSFNGYYYAYVGSEQQTESNQFPPINCKNYKAKSMSKQPTRIEIDLAHHERMKVFYYNLINALPAHCPKRKARAQYRFNFHRTRMEELFEIQRNHQTVRI